MEHSSFNLSMKNIQRTFLVLKLGRNMVHSLRFPFITEQSRHQPLETVDYRKMWNKNKRENYAGSFKSYLLIIYYQSKTAEL